MSAWVESEFEAIFSSHYKQMLRVVRRVVRTEGEAEEICSEVFLRLYRAGPEVTATGLVGGWLFRTGTRAAIDALRAHERRGVKVELDAASKVGSGTEGDPLNDLLARERVAQVRAVLARLKPEKAQLLLLRQSGLSYREIAGALEMHAASVGTMLARAEAEFTVLYRKQTSEAKFGHNRNAQRLKTAREER